MSTDDLRRKVWPLLVSIDPASVEPGPKLDDLKTHPEYNQVVLDVNRSLKRFPPGIPYEQRVALQDQLTILILRVIMKYPHLKYYQVFDCVTKANDNGMRVFFFASGLSRCGRYISVSGWRRSSFFRDGGVVHKSFSGMYARNNGAHTTQTDVHLSNNKL
jgi:hypothetical protein